MYKHVISVWLQTTSLQNLSKVSLLVTPQQVSRHICNNITCTSVDSSKETQTHFVAQQSFFYIYILLQSLLFRFTLRAVHDFVVTLFASKQ